MVMVTVLQVGDLPMFSNSLAQSDASPLAADILYMQNQLQH